MHACELGEADLLRDNAYRKPKPLILNGNGYDDAPAEIPSRAR